jgi:tetratricopeptide (TPR) repeat protein
MVEALKKGARLDELVGQTRLPYVEISRFLYALSILGIVVEEKDLPKAAPPQVEEKAVITPIATAVEGPALDPEEVERIRNEVMQAYLSYRKQDPFDLLGLGEDVESTEIQRSYIAYAEKFAPARFRQGDLISLLDKARDLFLSGACAYAVLIEPEERKRLIARRKRQREEAERKKKEAAADSFKIRTDLLDSEVQYKKGRALAQKGMFQEALRFFEFASDCDPQNGNYRAEKAFALYRVSPLLVKQSLDDLEEALRIDPSCSLAKRYIQEIQRMQGKAR